MATTKPPSLWRHRDFVALWGAVTASEVGTQVSQLALPLTAITLLKSGSLGVGVLRALETVPYLLIGLPAGVWVEHRRRRPVLVRADLIRLVVVASVPLAYATGHLTLAQMYVVAFVAGLASVFFDLAFRSYLPRMLDQGQLLEGNAKLSLSESVAQVGGPGLGGLLVGALGPAGAVAVDAGSFAVSAFGMLRLRGAERPPPVRDAGASTASLIGAGLRYVAGNSLLRCLTASTAAANLSLAMVETVLIVFLVKTLHLDAGSIGVVFLLGGTGVVAGALAAPRVTRRFGYGPTAGRALLVSLAGGVIAPLFATRHGGMWVVAASQWLVSFGVAIYSVAQVTLRQAVCPDSLQGRMNATFRFTSWGLIPIGNLAGGVLGQALGLRAALWLSVGVAAVASPWVWLRPVRSVQVLPERDGSPEPPPPPGPATGLEGPTAGLEDPAEAIGGQ